MCQGAGVKPKTSPAMKRLDNREIVPGVLLYVCFNSDYALHGTAFWYKRIYLVISSPNPRTDGPGQLSLCIRVSQQYGQENVVTNIGYYDVDYFRKYAEVVA